MVLACFFFFGLVLAWYFAWQWYGAYSLVCLVDMVLFASFGIVLPLFCFVLVWCLLGCYFDSSWDMGFALFLGLVFAMVSACIFDWFTMLALFCIVWDGAAHLLLGLGKVLARCSLIWYGGWLCLCLVFAMVLAFLGD